MTPLDINLYLFVLVVVIFAVIGFSAARREHSVKSYFHHESLSKNVVSLSATNITLGTGLIYLVTGAQHNGLLMLLIPVMVFLGYYLQAIFLEKATAVTVRSGKNFLASLDEEITLLTGVKSSFSSVVSGSLVVVFVLVLAFEIFASSKVIAPFLFKTPNVNAEIILSTVIFIITVLYTIIGGINATFKVDFIQVPLICIFLPVFIITTVPHLDHPALIIEKMRSTIKLGGPVLAAVAIASIGAISTQFYSILNWGAVSNVEVSNQQRLLKWVGGLSAVILAVFVTVGLLHPIGPGGQVWLDITETYSRLASQQNFSSYLLCGILLLGMASILLTTTDAVVITSIMFYYDNLAKGDSKNLANNPSELKRIRRIGAITFILCFALLMIINYWQPDPFYLLISMAGGVVVFAPMIVTAGFLSSRKNGLRIFTPSVVYAYFGLFLLAGAVNVFLLVKKSSLVGYIGVAAFSLSLVYSLLILLRVSKWRE